MKKLLLTFALLASMFSRTTSACEISYQVMMSAHELDRAADHFHELLHNYIGYSHLTNDAHMLAAAAEHLHQLAENNGSAGCEHLRYDFNNVQQSFMHLRQAFYYAHNTHHNYHIQHDWQDVEYAFGNLARSFYYGDHGDDDHGGWGHGHGGGGFPFIVSNI